MDIKKLLIYTVFLFFINCSKKPDTITLVNFENVENSTINLVKNTLSNHFHIKEIIVEKAPLPEVAYYKPRNRYRAEKLIKYLKDTYSSDKVIAITHKDISTTTRNHEDWGIMGLAYRSGKSCIVSTFRIKKNIKSEAHFNERLNKVILHEFGHTLGLSHCENSKKCLMRDAQGKVSTVDEVYGYCKKCQSKIKNYLK